jgi:hypothetical protein
MLFIYQESLHDARSTKYKKLLKLSVFSLQKMLTLLYNKMGLEAVAGYVS